MAYVPNFKYDIFISYRHINNEPLGGVADGWVTALVKSLTQMVLQKLKGNQPEFSFWMDFKLEYNEIWTPQILTALEDSALILIIMSSAYLESDWCRRERDSFLNSLKNRKGSNGRIFMVGYDEVEYDRIPAELKELRPINFWKKDLVTNEIKIFGFPESNPSQIEYWDKLLVLSNAISSQLNNLKHKPETLSPKSVIFLAEVTDDLEDKREEVKNYLDQHGIKSIPDSFYPREQIEFKKKMENDLSDCSLFVQLLSELPGKRISTSKTYPTFQYEIAAENSKVILQWRHRDLDLNKIRDNESMSLT
jgi:hypothetical protein